MSVRVSEGRWKDGLSVGLGKRNMMPAWLVGMSSEAAAPNNSGRGYMDLHTIVIYCFGKHSDRGSLARLLG